MTWKPNISIFLILSLLLLASFFRLWQLGSLPTVLHRDEASIGYNAYSLLKIGTDEHGISWPLNFKAFGDYKLPGLIYATIPFIQLLDLTPFSVRLPTALAAILTIPIFYWLIREIGWSKKTALLAFILLTFDFWHITQARNVYEPMVGLLWSSLAWACWLRARKNYYWLIPALSSYFLGALFYNVTWLLTPLLFLGSTIIDWQTFKKSKLSIFTAIIVLLFVALSNIWLLKEVNISRSHTTIFTKQDIIELSQVQIHASLVQGIISPVARAIYHPLILSSFQIGQNYLVSFNPTYLFFMGDQNPWHNLRTIGFGNSNPLLILPFILGLSHILTNLKKRSAQLSLLYLLASPLPSSLTNDAPITNRLLDFHLAVLVVSAVGVSKLFSLLKSFRYKKVVMGILISVYLGVFGLFMLRYFYSFNLLLSPFWNPEVDTMVKKVQDISSGYDQVYITSDFDLGYIFFAFYLPFEPKEFVTKAKWVDQGFSHVSEFDKYHFSNFPSWNNMDSENIKTVFSDTSKQILVVSREKSKDKIDTNSIFEIHNWKGDWLWYVWDININEAYTTISNLPPTPEREKVIQYLSSCIKSKCSN